VCRSIEIALGVDEQVGAFREGLTQQAVRVLVRTALPWALRVTRLDPDTGIDRELDVLDHHSTLIPRQRRPEEFGEALGGGFESSPRRLGVFAVWQGGGGGDGI
jgi:hypothetical protein